MTTAKQIAAYNRIVDLRSWIEDADRAIHDIVIGGASSASVSSGGGSKSYTRLQLDELRRQRSAWAQELAARTSALTGVGGGIVRHIGIVRS